LTHDAFIDMLEDRVLEDRVLEDPVLGGMLQSVTYTAL